MKTCAAKNKQSFPAMRKAHPYAHHPLGAEQHAHRMWIGSILRSTGAQAKLTIGQPDDKYEQEADRVADQVMAMPDPKLQRQPMNGEEEETLQNKPLANQITPLAQRQKETDKEEEEPFQAKSISSEIPAVSSGLEARINSLKGGGQPLPGTTRHFFESRMGRNFSSVRIHNNNTAAETAQAMQARAFTLRDNIVFNSGQYSPNNQEGKKLLAHELSHVVQQNTVTHQGETIGHIPASEKVIQRTPILPGYSQKGDTCGAASLVTALMIYDKQKGNHDASIAAIENILTWLIQYKTNTIKGWDKKGIDGKKKFKLIKKILEIIRDSLLAGNDITEIQYQAIGVALYFLYIDKSNGLSSSEIENLQNKLGLYSGKSDMISNGNDVFSNAVVKGLKPSQIAQVGWYVKTSGPDSQGKYSLGHHAFLIGRLKTGEWYLHDQGPQPTARYINNNLSGLEQHVRAESAADRYWLFFGTFTMRVVGGWTGAKLLEGDKGPINKQAGLVLAGTYLAEIDYSSVRFGDKVNSGKFLGVAHSRSNGYFICGSSGSTSKGRLMVEMPKGVFLVYETDSISSHNMHADAIDASEGGLLTRKKFYSAELILTDGNVCKKIKVY